MIAATQRLGRVAALAISLASGCAPLTMRGFDEIAAAGTQVELRGIPAWRSGDFSLGDDGARGRVARVAAGASITDDPLFQPYPDVESGAVARYGRYAFEVRGATVGGVLRGLCRYGREEAGLRMNDVTIATPSSPLALDCAFDDATGRIGEMEVDAEWPRGALLTAREGRVRVGAAVLTIRSAHLGEQVRGPVDEPLGYFFSTPSGATAGAAELPSGGRARLALPRDPAARRAALAAGIALALFWDPGDTD